jgi:hypothetical protein
MSRVKDLDAHSAGAQHQRVKGGDGGDGKLERMFIWARRIPKY